MLNQVANLLQESLRINVIRAFFDEVRNLYYIHKERILEDLSQLFCVVLVTFQWCEVCKTILYRLLELGSILLKIEK